jgi:hypothetical protein
MYQGNKRKNDEGLVHCIQLMNDSKKPKDFAAVSVSPYDILI